MLTRTQPDYEKPRDRVCQSDALEYTGNSGARKPVDHAIEEAGVRVGGNLTPGVTGEPRQQEPQQEDYHAASQHLATELGVVVPASPAGVHREYGGNAYDEQEVGENQVCWSPPVPLGVPERRVDG